MALEQAETDETEASTTYWEEFGWKKPMKRDWNSLTKWAWKRTLFDSLRQVRFIYVCMLGTFIVAGFVFCGAVGQGVPIPLLVLMCLAVCVTCVLHRDEGILRAQRKAREVDAELSEEHLRDARRSVALSKQHWTLMEFLTGVAVGTFVLAVFAADRGVYEFYVFGCAVVAVALAGISLLVLHYLRCLVVRTWARIVVGEWEAYRLSRGFKEGEVTVEAWEEAEFPRFLVRENLTVTFEWEEEACLVRHGELGVYGSGPTLEAAVADMREIVCCYVDDYFFAFEKATKSFWKEARMWLEFVELIDEPDPQVLREIKNAGLKE